MNSNHIQELIEQRASQLSDAFTSANVEKLMSFFSKDIKFSDIAMSAYDLNYTSLRGFYDAMYNNLGSMTIDNVTVSGTSPEFVTWEFDLGFVMKLDDEKEGLKAGQKVLMKGTAVQWWRKEEGSWKIWKERDYFIFQRRDKATEKL